MKNGIKTPAKGIKGTIDKLLAKNVERVLAIPGSRLYKHYEAATRQTAKSQSTVLLDILSYASQTVFGKEHGFDSIKNYKDYSAQVPVRNYEEHRPYVERHAKGEENILFPGKPMMYTRTSGTTAKPKLIPISPYNFERTIKNRGKLWLHRLATNYPGIFKGRDFSLVSPAVEGYTEDGTPYGSLSGLVYKNIPNFIKLVHTIPYDVLTASEFDAKAYTLLRFGVPSNVSAIFTGNPSTVLNLAISADRWKENLIRDIRDGTLDSNINLEPSIREKAEALLYPAPNRAAELEQIVAANDHLRPAEYWPNLRLVNTWTNGNCSLVLPKLKPWFKKNTPVLDFGYIASEINATDIVDPDTGGSLLSIMSGFYEFVRLEDSDDEQKQFYLAHELEAGQRYLIYVTTLSGLYRYDMNDVVEVIDHFNQTPIFRFLYKGKGITNIRGEKLSEAQLIEAVQSASAKLGVKHDFFVGYADSDKDCYTLYIELLNNTNDEQADKLAFAIDASLSQINIEYDAKRRSHRLKPLQIVQLGPDAFARYRQLRLKEGALEGQLKWLHLSATEATKERMKRLSDPPPEKTSI